MPSQFAATSQVQVLAALPLNTAVKLPGAPAGTKGGFFMSALLSVFVLASVFATPPAPSAPSQCSTALAPVAQARFDGGFTAQTTCIADCGPLNGIVSCSGS